MIENVYVLEDGALALRTEHFDATGWPPGEAEIYTPILLDCFDRGGWYCGLIDGEKLVGVAVLESRFIGRDRDQLQLKFLHVSNGYRGLGLGTRKWLWPDVWCRMKSAGTTLPMLGGQLPCP